MSRWSSGAASLAAVAMLGAAVPVVLAGPAAAEDVDCESVEEDAPHTDTTAESRPLAELLVARAHTVLEDRGAAPGGGVGVAVLGPGVRPGGPLAVAHEESFAGGGPPAVATGTIAAGLVAGRPRENGRLVGVAPAARIISVRVYDSPEPREGEVGPTTIRVAAGLDWVADNAGARGIRVAAVPLAVPGSPALEEAVRRVQRAGVVVVAATGDRPGSESDPLFETYAEPSPGEDAAGDVFPAGYPGVVGVGALATGGEDPGPALLRSSATDVVAPTVGAVSVALNGSTCLVTRLSSAYAAAEVSGVVALLRTRFPRETPEQIVARLVDTADGASDRPGPVTGAGMVQPVEALARELQPGRSGAMDRSRPAEDPDPAAVAPPPAQDRYAASRRDFVWWGLLAGGGLLLAVLLRPVLGRRRG